MRYVLLGIIILFICLWFVKIKLRIEKKDILVTTLIITNLFKYKINLNKDTSKSKNLKDVIKWFKIINNSFLIKSFNNAVVENVNIELFIEEDNNPYLIFLEHILLIEARKICYKYFKEVQKENFKIELGTSKSKGEIIISINLGKLVTIILQDYKSFKNLKFSND